MKEKFLDITKHKLHIVNHTFEETSWSRKKPSFSLFRNTDTVCKSVNMCESSYHQAIAS